MPSGATAHIDGDVPGDVVRAIESRLIQQRRGDGTIRCCGCLCWAQGGRRGGPEAYQQGKVAHSSSLEGRGTYTSVCCFQASGEIFDRRTSFPITWKPGMRSERDAT